MPDRRISFLSNLTFLFCTYFIITVVVSIHRYILGPTHYGNYLIFKNSFLHLLEGKDLYALYPELHIDLFKYSPTFAVFFSLFAIMPDYIGMILWNLLNGLALFFSVKMIPFEEKKKVFVLWFILIELITSMQNYQSNALTASLIIFVFVLLERKNFWIAGIALAAGFYIKLFGLLAAFFWFIYPGKIKFICASLIAFIILFAVPMLFVQPAVVIEAYTSWINLISVDTPHELNHSVMSVMSNWFGININKTWVQLAGILLLLIPLLKWNQFHEKKIRLLFLCSILIWGVIFNHKAESATYIIAVVGCAIWFFISERGILEKSLIILLLILTCLSPTDLFPKTIRENYIVPYSLKAIPSVFIWIKIQYELLTFRGRTEKTN